VLKPLSFPSNRLQKHFMFGGRFGVLVFARLEDGLCSTFCRIFSSNKNAPANRKGGFYTNHLPKNKEI
jgi:hypothetical protein